MSNKLEKVLLIKYIRDCIRQHEIDLGNNKTYLAYMNLLKNDIDEFCTVFEESRKEILQLFPNDATVNRLIESEMRYLNDFDLQNSQDKTVILQYLHEIDLDKSFDTIKLELRQFLVALKENATYHFQLSDILYGCLDHEQ